MRRYVIDAPGRLDAILAAAEGSRGAAKELILQGVVAINGKAAAKPSALAYPGDLVTVDAPIRQFVSRGGLKLAGALDAFGVCVRGRVCLDVGASTGGFTDCLLQRGAAKVYAVDTGSSQLADSLRADSRVVSMEQTNINSLTRLDLPETPWFACVDVSFVSVTKIMEAVFSLLTADGQAVFLVKPQFEAGRGRVGKKGVVKDKRARAQAVMGVYRSAAALGNAAGALIPSPITGGDGNVEYLLFFDLGRVGLTADAFASVCEGTVFG